MDLLLRVAIFYLGKETKTTYEPNNLKNFKTKQILTYDMAIFPLSTGPSPRAKERKDFHS